MSKYSNWTIGGKIVRDDERYVVKDNTDLKNLVLSSTRLKPNQSTGGHAHEGQEEIYFFALGDGTMQLNDTMIEVTAGDTVMVPDGAFHRVFNNDENTSMYFICVFNGKREE